MDRGYVVIWDGRVQQQLVCRRDIHICGLTAYLLISRRVSSQCGKGSALAVDVDYLEFSTLGSSLNETYDTCMQLLVC